MKAPSWEVQYCQVVLGFGLTSSLVRAAFKALQAVSMLHCRATVPLSGALGAAYRHVLIVYLRLSGNREKEGQKQLECLRRRIVVLDIQMYHFKSDSSLSTFLLVCRQSMHLLNLTPFSVVE